MKITKYIHKGLNYRDMRLSPEEIMVNNKSARMQMRIESSYPVYTPQIPLTPVRRKQSVAIEQQKSDPGDIHALFQNSTLELYQSYLEINPGEVPVMTTEEIKIMMSIQRDNKVQNPYLKYFAFEFGTGSFL